MQGWKPAARLAARRARLGQPEPQRAERVDGALLPGHRDARGHHALRGARHDAAARGVRRARPRRERAAGGNERARPALAAGLPRCAPAGSSPPSTSTPASSAPGVQIHVEDPHYEHEAFRPWRLMALAFKALRALQAGVPAVARFPVRVRDAGSRSTSSTAARCCASGWTTERRRRPISMRWRAPTRQAWREEREAVLLYR